VCVLMYKWLIHKVKKVKKKIQEEAGKLLKVMFRQKRKKEQKSESDACKCTYTCEMSLCTSVWYPKLKERHAKLLVK
jgi:hypothetical protein